MISRYLLSSAQLVKRRLPQFVRHNHRGFEGAPPQRFIPVGQHLATYLFVCFALLSYPSFVLYNLDNLRPRPENSLAPEVQAELERRDALRKAGKMPILQDSLIIGKK